MHKTGEIFSFRRESGETVLTVRTVDFLKPEWRCSFLMRHVLNSRLKKALRKARRKGWRISPESDSVARDLVKYYEHPPMSPWRRRQRLH